ncbi:uncharacterized protein BO97DRAFT_396496 [Aspergillus homomorphus CBS 101889]|uniref:Uncharacterized protein n=1 Tax=Aspergillus homomorphus (strain CBS 101889) TaxID=1450537 RepID=A0A395HNC6_ASPHC|nr:hypothetical protein BO97DRAFT_396496 [Aspergillus homomorphus CBS 101889]RAL09452.1 hypothetical protein BO97DRAFT_396496 [Aspergillus homomorphus CBS 101889]
MAEHHLNSDNHCHRCSPEYFLPLKKWVEKCAVSGKPEMARKACQTYCATIRRSELVVREASITICPHGALRMIGEDIPPVLGSQDLADRALFRNATVIYNILKWFNVETAHQILFDKGDNDLYGGPLLVFKDKDFNCLRNAEAVVDLIWEDHRTVESVVSSIKLDQWDDPNHTQ